LDFKRILVFRFGHLGDTLVAIPAFWTIRERFPNSHITLLSNVNKDNPGYVTAREVLPKNLFDDYIPYESKLELSLLKKLRSNNFDCIVYLVPRERSKVQVLRDKLFFYLAGIRHFVGSKYLLKNRIIENDPLNPRKVVEKVEPEWTYLVKCLSEEKLIDYTGNPRFDIELSREEKAFAANILKINGIEKQQKIIGVACGGKKPSRIWKEEKFNELITKLIVSENVIPIVFGGSEEIERGERLITSWGKGLNMAGNLSVRQSASLLSFCSLYIGNDTGVMHLAAAAGTKCIGIFSSADREGRFYPIGAGHIQLRNKFECEGCEVFSCPFENKCLESIGVTTVYNACIKVLNE
jgi:heptosyltransferase III